MVPNFPFVIVLAPTPALNSVACEFKDYTSQLRNLEAAGFTSPGQVLYEVHAVRDPVPDGPTADSVVHIGSLILDSSFATHSSRRGATIAFLLLPQVQAVQPCGLRTS